MPLKATCTLAFVLAACAPAFAQTPAKPPAEPPPPPFTGSIAAGLAATSGNTDTVTFNAAFQAKYDAKKRHVVKVEGLYLRGTSNGVVDVDRASLMGSDEYKLTPKLYVFGQMQYLHDRFKEVDYLLAPSGGVGYKFLDTARTSLSAQGGIGGVWEKDTNVERTASGAVVANQKFSYKISAGATLTEDVSALWKTGDFADALHTFGAGLALSVTTRVQVKVALLDTYKTRPPTETIKKNDLATILAFVYKL